MKNVFFLFMAIMVAACSKPGEPPQTAQKTSQKITPKSQNFYIEEAIQKLKDEDVGGAIKAFDEAIRRDPLNPKAYLVLGQVYMNMREYPRAIDTFAAATRVAPESGEAYYLLAMCHGFSGNKDLAIVNAQKSVEIFRQEEDENNFMRALALLRGLSQVKQ